MYIYQSKVTPPIRFAKGFLLNSQVCVWKRVREIDENLAYWATTWSVLSVCSAQGLLCNPEDKVFIAITGQ